MAGADRAHHARAAVLLVVGVEDEQHLERAREHRVGVVPRPPDAVHHREEVLGEAEVVVGVDVGQATVVAVRPGSDRRHLGDHADDLLPADLGVADPGRLRVEGGEPGNDADEHPHRVGVVPEPLHQALDVLVHERVQRDRLRPLRELRVGRQLSVDEEVGDLEVGALLGELLDRIAAVAEDPAVAVDVRDRASNRCGVEERGVVGHEAEVVLVDLDRAQRGGADRAVLDGDLVARAGAVVGDRQRVGHGPPPSVQIGCGRVPASAGPCRPRRSGQAPSAARSPRRTRRVSSTSAGLDRAGTRGASPGRFSEWNCAAAEGNLARGNQGEGAGDRALSA